MSDSTVAKTAGPVKCSCGLWYADQNGIDCCTSNRHHDGKDPYGSRNEFAHVIDTTITMSCAECNEPLTGTIRHDKHGIEIDIYPHICAVEEPEDAE